MRTLPTTLTSQYGTSLDAVLTIDGNEYTNILELPAVDSRLSLDNVGSFSVQVTLDDTDLRLKGLIDSKDVHKLPVTLTVSGLTVINGQVFSPIVWSEAEQTITVTITSMVEEQEYGFSPERGQLDYVSPDAIGNAWPLVFGSPRYVPMVRVYHQPTATTEDRFCIVDPILYQNRERLMNAYNQALYMFGYFDAVRAEIIAAVDALPYQAEARTFEEFIYGQLVKTNIVAYQNFYVWLIQQEIANQRTVWTTVAQLEVARETFAANNDRASEKRIEELEAQLEQLAGEANDLSIKKDVIESILDEIQNLFEAEKNATAQQLSWLNTAFRVYEQFVNNEQTICEQERCVRTSIRVRGIEVPVGQQTVTINQVNYLTTTVDETMTFNSGPLPVYTDITPEAWAQDDDPCNFSARSLDLLRVPANVNVRGMYLLVKKINGLANVRHVLKVVEQVGTKVYYKLVAWERDGSGGPRGQSPETFLDSILGINGQQPPNHPYDLGSSYGGFDWGTENIFWQGGYDPAFATDSLRSEVRAILAENPNLTREELINIIRFMSYRRLDNLSQVQFQVPTPRDIYTIISPDIEVIEAAAGKILPQWFDYYIPPEELDGNNFIDNPAGSEVRYGDECDVYVANTIMSTVHALHAYREDEAGNRVLDAVPSSYYTVAQRDLGKYDTTTVIFPTPLGELGEKWEETIFCTQTSSVGRNVVDVVDWLMSTYTNLTPSNDIRTLVDAYPVDFALFETGNTLAKVREILYESRIGLRSDGSTYELVYLSKTPSSVVTITTADYHRKSLVETQGSNVITSFRATWNGGDYLPKDKPFEKVIRNNVTDYGLIETEQEYKIYSIGSLVDKSLEFNALRGSFPWERVSLRCSCHMWLIEPLDAVTFNGKLHLVESANMDLVNGTVDLMLHTGTIAGESEQFKYFWPSATDPLVWVRNDPSEVTGSVK